MADDDARPREPLRAPLYGDYLQMGLWVQDAFANDMPPASAKGHPRAEQRIVVRPRDSRALDQTWETRQPGSRIWEPRVQLTLARHAPEGGLLLYWPVVELPQLQVHGHAFLAKATNAWLPPGTPSLDDPVDLPPHVLPDEDMAIIERVVTYLRAGWTDREVCEQFSISESTLRRLKRKARRLGLLPPGRPGRPRRNH